MENSNMKLVNMLYSCFNAQFGLLVGGIRHLARSLTFPIKCDLILIACLNISAMACSRSLLNSGIDLMKRIFLTAVKRVLGSFVPIYSKDTQFCRPPTDSTILYYCEVYSVSVSGNDFNVVQCSMRSQIPHLYCPHSDTHAGKTVFEEINMDWNTVPILMLSCKAAEAITFTT